MILRLEEEDDESWFIALPMRIDHSTYTTKNFVEPQILFSSSQTRYIISGKKTRVFNKSFHSRVFTRIENHNTAEVPSA